MKRRLIPTLLLLTVALVGCDQAAVADAGSPAPSLGDAGAPPAPGADAGPPPMSGSDAGMPPMGSDSGPGAEHPRTDAGPTPTPDAGPGGGGTYLCCVDGARLDCVDTDTLLACVRGDTSGCVPNGRCD